MPTAFVSFLGLVLLVLGMVFFIISYGPDSAKSVYIRILVRIIAIVGFLYGCKMLLSGSFF